MRLGLLFIIFIFSLKVSAQIRIGVLSNRGDEVVYKTWNESRDYLQKELKTEIDIIPLAFDEVSDSIASKKIDYIFMNPMIYVQNEFRHDIKKLLTTRRFYKKKGMATFGSVILVRKGTLLPKVKLSNIKISAVHPSSFGGWLVGRYVLEKHGVPISLDRVSFKYDHYAVVQDVLLGKNELGIVRTGVLEELIDKGMLGKNDLRVLYQRNDTPYEFLSSELYPSWPIASLPHVTDKERADFALALLKISALKPEYMSRIGFEWGLPSDYKKVNEMLKAFKVYPYDKIEKITLGDIYRNNRVMVYGVVLTIMALIFLLIFALFDRRQKSKFNTIIKRERDELKRFLEILPIPVLLLDSNFIIIRTNIAFTSLVGGTEKDIIGKKIKNFIRGVDCNKFTENILEKGHSQYAEDVFVINEKEILTPVGIEAFSYRFEGEPISVVTFKDLSSQKELTKLQKEWELRRYEEEKVRSVGILGSGVAHEINNPLTIINSSTKVLQKYLSKEVYDVKRWSRMLEDIHVAGSRISNIVNALSLLGRRGEDSLEELQPIGNFFQSALVLLSSKFMKKGIPIHFNYKYMTELAYYSHAKMHQYLVNLLLNAEHALEKSEEKWVNMEVDILDETFFTVRISNSGPLIDQSMIDNIFIPFASTEQAITGKGMSLAQTKSYLNKHHGDIWVDREAPHTTFVIKYPFDHRQIA